MAPGAGRRGGPKPALGALRGSQKRLVKNKAGGYTEQIACGLFRREPCSTRAH